MKSNSKETNRIVEPSKLAVKFANTVFVLVILSSVLVVVYAVYKIYNKPEYVSSTFYFSSLLFAGLSAALFVLGLMRLPDEFKVNLSVLLITVGISVYGFETYLEFFYEETQSHESLAKKMGVPFDTRRNTEVIEELIDSGIKAYFNFGPKLRVKPKGKNEVNGMIYNLGGISNITTILSNESGYYPVIETDEYGFHNPKGLYKKNKVDIILIGDSYTEGFSVNSNENFIAELRKSDFNVISLGKAGNGPLKEFASLKEYAEPFKPKIVLWVYYINDLEDLGYEISETLLKKYLIDDKFSQNLISRQKEIDTLLLSEFEKGRGKGFYNWKDRLISLVNLRDKINLTGWGKKTSRVVTISKAKVKNIFKDILQRSKQMVSGWGGEMYFVYIPPFSRYSKGSLGATEYYRNFVLKTATELEIPIIDIQTEVFDTHLDPLSLFPFRIQGHYTAEGHQLMGESISKRLKADGIFPLNSKN